MNSSAGIGRSASYRVGHESPTRETPEGNDADHRQILQQRRRDVSDGRIRNHSACERWLPYTVVFDLTSDRTLTSAASAVIGSTSAFEFVHGCVAGRAADVPYRFYAAVVNGGHVLTDVRPEVSPGWATSGGLPDPSCQAVGTDAASTVVGPALRPVVPDSGSSRRVCVPGPQIQSTPGSWWLRAVRGALAIGALAPLRVGDFPAESGPQAVVLRQSRCRSRTAGRPPHRLAFATVSVMDIFGVRPGTVRQCCATYPPTNPERTGRPRITLRP